MVDGRPAAETEHKRPTTFVGLLMGHLEALLGSLARWGRLLQTSVPGLKQVRPGWAETTQRSKPHPAGSVGPFTLLIQTEEGERVSRDHITFYIFPGITVCVICVL